MASNNSGGAGAACVLGSAPAAAALAPEGGAKRKAEGQPSPAAKSQSGPAQPGKRKRDSPKGARTCAAGSARELCIGMVGLPARGKTYTAAKLDYYLNWMQIRTGVFNHGQYRRKRLPAHQKAQFYDPDDAEGSRHRQEFADEAMKDMLAFFDDRGGQVGILDATNSTAERRNKMTALMKQRNTQMFWVESICEDVDKINANIAEKVKNHPEFAGMDAEQATEDFKQRIANYRKAYTTLDPEGEDGDKSFIQNMDLGKRFFVSRPQGVLEMRIVRYLMSVHIRPRSIYLTRHGESEYNRAKLIGGDSGLTPAGRDYSRELRKFMDKENTADLKVWTSSMKRTIQTSAHFQGELIESFKALDEIDAGECDGISYAEIQKRFPQVNERRSANKYFYRYPRGESYRDVVERLEPMILELEREENVLVIAHQAVCRCLLAYFSRLSHSDLPKKLPYIHFPLHTVMKITPTNSGCNIQEFHLGPAAVSTHVPPTTQAPTPRP